MTRPVRSLAAGVLALLTAVAPRIAAQAPQTPTFKASVELVTTDAIPRNTRSGQFIADLRAGEFEVYEDGVRQELASVRMVHGGREYNLQAPPTVSPREGILLPASRPVNDAAGRIFLIFIDDLHLDFSLTPRLRRTVKQIADYIHDGDMFGIVSTGTTSIEQQLTYDRQILISIADKVKGEALKPEDIIQSSNGVGQGSELRHRAQVAFQTAYELVNNLQKVQNRRKAVIYISSGYDFNPFEQSRADRVAEIMQSTTADLEQDPFYRQQRSGEALSEGDLYKEEAELIRAANRANASFFAIDPRGLVAGPDITDPVKVREYQQHVLKQQDSLRTLAENTGGIAMVNMNDISAGLKRMDAETSDYYLLSFYSSNPDRVKRIRHLEVRVTRPGIQVKARSSYSIAPTTNTAK